MRITRRQFVAGTSLATAALALGGRSARADQQTVRIGYIADFNGGSLYAIAEDQGYWEPEGLAPDLKVFTNGPLQIQALGAGSLDFGYIGPGALWLPASGKTKVVAINSIGFADRVIAQAGINTMADLKGKKVGVPEGTSGDMLLRLALQKAGMTIDDIQQIKMDPSTVVAAFSSRQIDAAGIWYPLIGIIKKNVPDLKELAGSRDFYPEHSFPTAMVARNDVVTDEPELIAKYLRVLRKAMDYRAANMERSIELTAGLLGVSVENVRADAANCQYFSTAELVGFTRDGTVDKWLSGMNALFTSFGKLDKPLPPKEFYTADLFVAG
ncbi:aliphatic sulfonate ABC transporter substrate-binding protein (plasmid) [Phyllobacteriaceae bacterium JZ32]